MANIFSIYVTNLATYTNATELRVILVKINMQSACILIINNVTRQVIVLKELKIVTFRKS